MNVFSWRVGGLMVHARKIVCAMVTNTLRNTKASRPAVRLNAGAMPFVRMRFIMMTVRSAPNNVATAMLRSVTTWRHEGTSSTSGRSRPRSFSSSSSTPGGARDCAHDVTLSAWGATASKAGLSSNPLRSCIHCAAACSTVTTRTASAGCSSSSSAGVATLPLRLTTFI